ncbi:MAG: nucleotidyltransferase domain-containing protein [Planctomycetaceae bacterium]|nr:nucleotidyltransferase domain-containing protein [Planctomycetaceae bacterium]
MFDNDSDPLPCPADRECLIPHLPETLDACWNRSRESLQRIRDVLSKEVPTEVVTIYVCGSMGRMEQLPGSDCDLIIVTIDDIPPESDQGRAIHAEIWKRLEPLGLIRPKPNGIFSETVTWGQLINPDTRGQVDEDQFVYGKRIQLLLDSQPVYHEDHFVRLQREVLQRFQRGCDLPEQQWLGLLNEVIRYWKALGVRSLWLDDRSVAEWRYINLKFRHSRNLLIFGFLMLLGEASRRQNDSLNLLHSGLTLTPLERVCRFAKPDPTKQLTARYAHFLQIMADEEFVCRLRDVGNPEQKCAEFVMLDANATEFVHTFTEILHSQSETWPLEFRHELLL